MDKSLSDGFKKVSVSSMLTYIRGLSAENIDNILKWARTSKKPDANINTTHPNEWEKNLKTIFSQFTPQEQAEVVSQAARILDEKKSLEAKEAKNKR